MEMSQRNEGAHGTISTCGRLIAHTSNSKLRTSYAQQPATLLSHSSIRTAAKDVSALKWSSDSTDVAIVSNKLVEVQAVDRHAHPTQIENGSGSLGRFAAADFVGRQHLLTSWEFGRAKIWDLRTGKGTDLGDLKSTSDEPAWQQRPDSTSDISTIALLTRPAAEDTLTMHFPELSTSMQPLKLPTVDAQSMSWSPDGRWLAVLDTPTASPSVYFYTPDAHQYRSYPSAATQEADGGLGVKALTWSADSRVVALSRYDGTIVLLNTITFTPLAIIKHTIDIDQNNLPPHQQTPIWREAVSASNERSYTLANQPVSPPPSRTKPTTEPTELGVAEASFSSDGSYLATRDERMLSTVWIWNVATLAAHAVVMQHSNVRKAQWHPTRASLIMLDCGEGIAYLYDVATSSAPVAVNAPLPGSPTLSWVHTAAEAKLAVLAAARSSFWILYPEGAESISGDARAGVEVGGEEFQEGASEDSLLDILSGRKPAPPYVTEQSYTQIVELEMGEADEGADLAFDDTFREKRKVDTDVVDPLDDSQIF
ncbi:hypothetical protein LTR91_008240 [Friedmanniomyces endolithicus]|uniref:Uncharacterized protein n=1 Tax=Friedmanniomyces endolithicus TaxID=329885 RepID=A0AAN6QV75_9PEZI|nr:hypothetical protein LTR94_012045 [Friedmanniomyces endolithicus]KAK0791775.1 hypothetical protein LTR38_010095 [Friedmanniomyces endolithicus]KAK0801443.1 hypothetical protein LTR75_008586 [Friedmanniomyces endolithicus]KAK0802382.1 hypothetical protein LTR59_005118 [Friedmanniomyces endolithicus]KAK0838428.1 hypothetical protein LTR03_012023 [Friedmanniomyces endolithicus]